MHLRNILCVQVACKNGYLNDTLSMVIQQLFNIPKCSPFASAACSIRIVGHNCNLGHPHPSYAQYSSEVVRAQQHL